MNQIFQSKKAEVSFGQNKHEQRGKIVEYRMTRDVKIMVESDWRKNTVHADVGLDTPSKALLNADSYSAALDAR